MKTRILALAAILVLALSAAAVAGTHKLTGKARGDSNSKVTVKIKTSKSGKPTRVLSVAFKNLDYECQGSAGTFTGEVKSGKVSKKGGFKLVKGTDAGKTFYYLTGAKGKSGGAEYELGAQISANGRKIKSGSVRRTGIAGPQGTFCQVAASYTAKVKK